MGPTDGGVAYEWDGLLSTWPTDASNLPPEVIDEGVFPDGSFAPQINWGPTVTDPSPAAPLSGGTLTLLHDQRLAASDPDRDLVYLIDVTGNKVDSTVSLGAGDQPGRLVEDAAGHIHVVLRGAGAVVTLGADGSVLDRHAVCAIPRGIDYDKTNDQVWVACTGGELLALPVAGGDAKVAFVLDRDLRDVVVDGATLYVSRFRAAEVLVVDSATGQVSSRMTPPSIMQKAGSFSPAVAWRMIGIPGGGGVLLSHQLGFDGLIQAQPGGYGAGGGCTGIVQSTVTQLRPNQDSAPAAPLDGVVLPVDIALAADGQTFTVASAGNYKTPSFGQTFQYTGPPSGDCAPPQNGQGDGGTVIVDGGFPVVLAGQVTAVAYLASGDLAVQTREPAQLAVPSLHLIIPLSTVTREDTGHAIFHNNSGAGLACASCHPEGGDDGRTWNFDQLGLRRTPVLRGNILATAPFHWGAEEKDMPTLITDVFVGRMSGPPLDTTHQGALSRYVGAIPALPGITADPAAIARGQALFNDSTHNCVSCHSGAKFTNNQTMSVGTGGGNAFQVPSLLGAAWRAPFLHDGSAATLAARFDPAIGGGDAHGHTSDLTANNIADLVAYLESL